MPPRQIPRLLVLSAGLLASAAQASLVTNGGFETGDFSGWTQIGPLGPVGSYVVSGGEQHDGSYHAMLIGSGSANGVSQMLDTVAGQTYTVSFWLSNPVDCNGGCWFDFNWDGVSAFTSADEPAFGYRQFTYQLQASSSSTLLQFYLLNSLSAYMFMDDVSVEPAAPTGTVPEPATLALTLTALLGGAAASRRRRQASTVFGSRLFKAVSAGVLIAASFTLAGAARADVVKSFTWTIDSRTPTGGALDSITATGTLTVADTPTTGSFRLITGLTGVLNGEAMTLVPPDIFPGVAPSDNLIDIDASELTYNGLTFAAGGLWWNVYFDTTQFSACSGPANSPVGCGSFFDVNTFVLGDPPLDVPTPATLPLVAVGVLALLAASRPQHAPVHFFGKPIKCP